MLELQHAGMTVTIRVGNRNEIPSPPLNFPTCGNYLMPIFDDSDQVEQSMHSSKVDILS